MKKVLFIMIIVALLVAIAAPVFADTGGEPNDQAVWGELHKNEFTRTITEVVKKLTKFAAKEFDVDTNWGQVTKVAKELLGK